MSTFEVRRSSVIPAAAEDIFPLVNNFHEWTAWSPWETIDPRMSRRYFGTEAGTGAGYEWSGNRKAGSGTMEIEESVPSNLVRIRLQFTKPFKALNPTTFTFTPAPGGTEVTWRMTGENKGLGRVFALFMNMDKMVGADFERGLAALAATVAARKS
ncbi:SRPBCC family protein [Arthrobacter sp. FX8]|uniref:SRPBCC family protein n=1 Tax=unclassified Arthrobacter TaxID=235627 RepID=UPI00037B5522|nr:MULTISPECIES: SRPBCC family protein [unclassified Arthrobacter]TWD48359.1 polyketide cyclase/dehydrase/lipid transport protein [Arthrobacter sp. AG367]WAJ33724.1 SRPBCC family protein [Arthrobacter sp. FX8]BCW53547.1 potassium-transporting ATPase subunit F [Arthrobacter sp. StoSoilB19]BCW74634.1 potassium-transporting ATPase subunit F [Arthrobacter sp. NicSoilB11]